MPGGRAFAPRSFVSVGENQGSPHFWKQALSPAVAGRGLNRALATPISLPYEESRC